MDLADHLLRFGFGSGDQHLRARAVLPGTGTPALRDPRRHAADTGERRRRAGSARPTCAHAPMRSTVTFESDQLGLLPRGQLVGDRQSLLNLGVRSEAFDNKDSDGDTYIEIDDMIAPRFGFSWDMSGDSRSKLFGNVGRYFLPVANVINIKQAGALRRRASLLRVRGSGGSRLQRRGLPAADLGDAVGLDSFAG